MHTSVFKAPALPAGMVFNCEATKLWPADLWLRADLEMRNDTLRIIIFLRDKNVNVNVNEGNV